MREVTRRTPQRTSISRALLARLLCAPLPKKVRTLEGGNRGRRTDGCSAIRTVIPPTDASAGRLCWSSALTFCLTSFSVLVIPISASTSLPLRDRRAASRRTCSASCTVTGTTSSSASSASGTTRGRGLLRLFAPARNRIVFLAVAATTLCRCHAPGLPC